MRVEKHWQHITGEAFDESMRDLLNFDPVEASVNLDVLSAAYGTGGNLILSQVDPNGKDSTGVLCERPLGGYNPCPKGFALFFGITQFRMQGL